MTIFKLPYHFSAGVGRTGTYIALDILTRQGQAEGAVDVPACMHQLRQDRPKMVQTAVWFVLHSCC